MPLKHKLRYGLIFLAGVIQLACCRVDSQPSGIQFNARALGYGDRTRATRTAYSGDEVSSGGNTIERIDWVDGDKLMIYSPQATDPDNGDAHYVEYAVISHTGGEGQVVSTATIAPSAGGTGLVWGNGDHTFYGMYPSPGYAESPYGSARFTEGTMVFSLPASQAPVKQGSTPVYAPDMSLAPMLCKAGPVVAGTPEVNLAFVPQYTAFQFTVSRGGNDAVTLKRFALTSKTGNLTGSFTVPNTAYTDPTAVTVENGGAEIVFDRSSSPIVLDASSPSMTFTLLAVPEAVSGLKLSILVDAEAYGVTKTNVTSSITFQTEEGEDLGFVPYNKYQFTGLDFPLLIGAEIDDRILWEDYSLSVMESVAWWMGADLENFDWNGSNEETALTGLPDWTSWWSGTQIIDAVTWASEHGNSPITETTDNISWWEDSQLTETIDWKRFGSIELSSSADEFLWRTQTCRRSVTAYDDDGAPYTDVDVAWSVSASFGSHIVSINAESGLATALAPGSAVITATVTDRISGQSATLSYMVYVNAPTGIALTSSAASVSPGGTASLSTTLTYTANCAAPSSFPDDFLLWNSSEPGYVTLDATQTVPGTTVTATGVAAGTSTVSVSVNPRYADDVTDAKDIACNE